MADFFLDLASASSPVPLLHILLRYPLLSGVVVWLHSTTAGEIRSTRSRWIGRHLKYWCDRWFGGSIPAAGITLGTQKINSDLSWRLPLIFQCVPAFLVICIVWFLPESPRWLLANERDDEALEFLTRYHGGGDPNHPVVELEWKEFKDSISTDGSDKRWYDYSELVKTNSARWRSLMVLFMVNIMKFTNWVLWHVKSWCRLSLVNSQATVWAISIPRYMLL